jgi:dynein heavy chain
VQERAKNVLDDVLEKIPESFDFEDITSRVTERTPYTVVFLQEIERMNLLLAQIRRSLMVSGRTRWPFTEAFQ